MTERGALADSFLKAVGGIECTDRADEHPEGIDGVWLPRAAWLSIVEGMVRGQVVLVPPTASEH